jgi:hypothetical protein
MRLMSDTESYNIHEYQGKTLIVAAVSNRGGRPRIRGGTHAVFDGALGRAQAAAPVAIAIAAARLGAVLVVAAAQGMRDDLGPAGATR